MMSRQLIGGWKIKRSRCAMSEIRKFGNNGRNDHRAQRNHTTQRHELTAMLCYTAATAMLYCSKQMWTCTGLRVITRQNRVRTEWKMSKPITVQPQILKRTLNFVFLYKFMKNCFCTLLITSNVKFNDCFLFCTCTLNVHCPWSFFVLSLTQNRIE